MKLRLSPSTVIAAIALVAALGGTAFAAGAFTKKQKKQVTKIATTVFDSRIGGASVKFAETAGEAETAARATEARKATEAAKATEALRAVEATRADVATKAGEATKAMEAAKATEAAHADEATRATTATNAEQLGGKPAGDFQVRVGSCPPPQTISSVAADGTVVCTTPVRAIRIELGGGAAKTVNLGNDLEVTVTCSAPTMGVVFKNTSLVGGNLNRMLADSQGPEVTGALIQPGGQVGLNLAGRTEGQVVWAPAGSATTTLVVNLFRAAAGNFCELTGTAQTAG